MIERLLILFMTRLTSYLLTKGLAQIHGAQQKATTEKDIDLRLSAFKNAYKEAFNGEPVTPEQRKKLDQAIRDFIINPDSHGM